MNRTLAALSILALGLTTIPASAQNLCGAIGNCAPGVSAVNPMPRQVLKPSIGSFQNRDDTTYGRYRYVQPDQQIDVGVQSIRPSQRSVPRISGSRTIYKVENLSGDHVDWCFAKYRSYRAKDNTYQPSEGPRTICVSPFSK